MNGNSTPGISTAGPDGSAGQPAGNVDHDQVAHFDALSADWWDSHGALRTLHHLNPARMDYIRERCPPLAGRRTLDVGCGGGILSEALAADGAVVTGIDLTDSALDAARLHLHESRLEIRYLLTSAEALAEQEAGQYPLVTCLELLEHVPDPLALIDACARLAAPGADLVFSTINRTPRAWALAILGAEYVAGLLPRGTHEYERFLRPSELAAAGRRAGLELADLRGLGYNPLTGRARLQRDLQVNYLAHLRKPA